jgi:PAS domain S-box-containing protein
MGAALPIIQAGLVGEALESGPVGVLVADDDARYVAVNRYACELLGYTREELLELGVPDVAAGDRAVHDYQAFLAEPSWRSRYALRHKDGSVAEYEVIASETRLAGLQFYVSLFWPAD